MIQRLGIAERIYAVFRGNEINRAVIIFCQEQNILVPFFSGSFKHADGNGLSLTAPFKHSVTAHK